MAQIGLLVIQSVGRVIGISTIAIEGASEKHEKSEITKHFFTRFSNFKNGADGARER